MIEEESVRIDFPCDYPIKIVGEAKEEFTATVVALTQRHAPEVTSERVSVRSSRGGKYTAVTITIRATGEPQLRRLHDDLKGYAAVRLVL